MNLLHELINVIYYCEISFSSGNSTRIDFVLFVLIILSSMLSMHVGRETLDSDASKRISSALTMSRSRAFLDMYAC